MNDLIERLRYEAVISDRPVQSGFYPWAAEGPGDVYREVR